MSNQRTLEIVFGVVALLSVVSVPIPVRQVTVGHALQAPPPPVARLDLQRLEDLQRVALNQRDDLTTLARETRSLVDIFDAQVVEQPRALEYREPQAALPRPEGRVALPRRPHRPGQENPRYDHPY